MPVHSPEIFGGGGDRISEREKALSGLRRTRNAGDGISGLQILGEGLLRFDRWAGRGDDSRLYQVANVRGARLQTAKRLKHRAGRR
jgi:hypothetical protein